MSARRPLLTATAAGTLLCALWFVPSANATAEAEKDEAAAGKAAAASSEEHLSLADTGSVDTTPYLIGGTAFLGVGAGFVAFSMRRARLA
ncbi:hypothetical protein NLX86_12980 [Streptomyces sp. A3M-1-3]|uniref:hypothetical protein n=1 Tax=Streptomyces sp. A3M-1-3 TaxID=2962044 RepID=UPI0020B9010B|nr:hypothetical protein [Streptomyces sp. A3M-1-3]MCP3818994.1 hypothetical protein [Streptomyces sp. A3M-1-3]